MSEPMSAEDIARINEAVNLAVESLRELGKAFVALAPLVAELTEQLAELERVRKEAKP